MTLDLLLTEKVTRISSLVLSNIIKLLVTYKSLSCMLMLKMMLPDFIEVDKSHYELYTNVDKGYETIRKCPRCKTKLLIMIRSH